MRFVLGTVIVPVPDSKTSYAFYIVIERMTNVSRDWKIRFGTDDHEVAKRELVRLNHQEEMHDPQARAAASYTGEEEAK